MLGIFKHQTCSRPPPSIVFEPLKTVPQKQPHFELGPGSGAHRPPHKSVSYATVEIGDHNPPPHPAPFRAPEPVHGPLHRPVTAVPIHRPAPVHITVPPPVEGSHLVWVSVFLKHFKFDLKDLNCTSCMN